MADVHAIAAAYGVRVELADLGDWSTVRLIAEYDPDGPVIRVNERELSLTIRRAEGNGVARTVHTDRSLSSWNGDSASVRIRLAIAHELYHHLEAIGEIPRITQRAAREAAADAFAEHLTGMAGAFPDAVVHTAAAAPGR